MSHSALGPQFFHGSPEEFEPGDELRPTAATGRPTTRGDSLADRVYVTPHQFVAAQYTWHPDQFGTQDTVPRGHIYEVEPTGRRLNNKNAPLPGMSYTVKGARVIRKLDPKEWR